VVLAGDQITDVFDIVIGVQARHADVQVVQTLGGTPEVLAEYIWDHWLSEPDEPTQQQVLVAVNYVLQHPEQSGDHAVAGASAAAGAKPYHEQC
jgi:hypothetical protein